MEQRFAAREGHSTAAFCVKHCVGFDFLYDFIDSIVLACYLKSFSYTVGDAGTAFYAALTVVIMEPIVELMAVVGANAAATATDALFGDKFDI